MINSETFLFQACELQPPCYNYIAARSSGTDLFSDPSSTIKTYPEIQPPRYSSHFCCWVAGIRKFTCIIFLCDGFKPL